MSGCAHCVYGIIPSFTIDEKDALSEICCSDVHLEELEYYHSLIATQRAKLLALLSKDEAEPMSEEEWPIEFGSLAEHLATIRGSGTTQSEGERIAASRKVAEKEAKALRSSLPIAQRAFLEFEETLRKRRRSRELAALKGLQGRSEGTKGVI